MNLKEFFERDRFAKLAGAELMEIKPGYAKAKMEITENHLNGGGICQGGAIFTLADLAFAAAVNSHLVLTFSTTSTITYFKNQASGFIYAEAREIVDHHKMPFAEVKVTNERGELMALFHASGFRKQNVKIEADMS